VAAVPEHAPEASPRPHLLPDALPGVPAGEHQLESYRLLVETSHLLLERGSLEEVLTRVADALAKLLSYDAVTIYTADPERRLLYPVLSHDPWADALMREPVPYGRGLVGWVAEHREPANVDHNDPRLYQVPGTPVEPESLIVIPLVARGELCGVFAVYREGTVMFTEDEFSLAQIFADQAALAIESARAHDALEARARTDSVTGLANHRFFHEELRAELNRGHRYRHPVAIVLLDLDDFKGINDRYGHLEGDEALRRLGGLLVNELRGNDHACRIGGEEFGLILPHTDRAGAHELAERVRRAVESTSFGRVGSLSISGGVAAAPEDASDATALIEAADLALYASKRAGKNRMTLHAPGLEQVRDVASTEPRLNELAVLESLAHRVASLGDPREIGELIALELRGAIDYHHCRVHVLDATGEWLEPVAASGNLFLDGPTPPDLRLRVGEGVTGTAVATGRSIILDDASEHPNAVQLAGTPQIEESLLVVPMRYDQRTVGAIALSKLGRAQFTAADRRLVEILASHAAVAFENAALSHAQRRSTDRAAALLKLAADAAGRGSLRQRLGLLRRALDAEWMVLLRSSGEGDALAAEVSAPAALGRSLRGLELELGPVGRVARLAVADQARLPARARGEWAVRLGLDAETVLVAGADSAAAERAMRGTLRELADRLPLLLEVDQAADEAVREPADRRARRRRRVHRVSADLPAGVSRTGLLKALADHVCKLIDADGATISLYDAPTNTVRYLAESGLDHPNIEDVSFPVHLTLAGPVLHQGRVVVVDDYRRHPQALPFFLERGVRSAALVPFTAGGQIAGTLAVFTVNREHRFTTAQIAMVEVVAQQAGALIFQDELYAELETSYRATVEALTNALSVKDAYTSEHVREIAELARTVGAALEVGPRRMQDLEYAAILHDIGKIGVPTEILTKPGPLDDQEWRIVQRHTEIGWSLLKDIPFLRRVADIVRSAHERWDGTGYPRGLAGEQIALESRIIFVCDAWHAMRSDRPYRAALEADEARTRLADGAGTQFDPNVVEIFLRDIAKD
jgi:diguanylate cyclase (GGDEF)-like protein